MKSPAGGTDARHRRARSFLRAWLPAVLCCAVFSGEACFRRSTLPPGLTNQEWWRLIESLSEPAGAFTVSDNVVSNEPNFADAVRRLRPTGGVYVGVGPEQNFSYIVGLRPGMAFIIDIRRENLALHLLYKALFEVSTDRVDFVSRLFSRPRPELDSSAGVDEIFDVFDRVLPSAQELGRTSSLIRERLLTGRGFPLSQGDLEWIDHALKSFYTTGPNIDYYGARSMEAVRPSYRQLMTARDINGRRRSFLGTEEGFRFVKELQSKNLIVPVVGDFGGPHAIRRVGDYVRTHKDRVHAVYGSNVGVYLSSQQTRAFCRNLTALPIAPRAWFIDSRGVQPLDAKLKACFPEPPPAAQ
jgi:hypothetical protein